MDSHHENNYFGFIHNTRGAESPARTSEGGAARPHYKEKIQYSTGVAGDGTAVKAMHDFGGKEPAMAYLEEELQANDAGPPAASTAS
ncbi:2-aminoethylphosphonate ABC transporter substrate-binding protein [Streptomyces californicus]